MRRQGTLGSAFRGLCELRGHANPFHAMLDELEEVVHGLTARRLLEHAAANEEDQLNSDLGEVAHPRNGLQRARDDLHMAFSHQLRQEPGDLPWQAALHARLAGPPADLHALQAFPHTLTPEPAAVGGAFSGPFDAHLNDFAGADVVPQTPTDGPPIYAAEPRKLWPPL
eukprot:scaffold7835_cov382-Pinguiococcus_pyrenoidosus.AAC.1